MNNYEPMSAVAFWLATISLILSIFSFCYLHQIIKIIGKIIGVAEKMAEAIKNENK